MNKCLILAFALAAYNVTQAREIKGLIAAENDTTALPGVLCRLYYGDMLVQKSVSDHSGAFTIATEKNDEVILRFSLAGFSETEILIAPGTKNLDLGQILLTESINLDELTVTSKSQYNVRGRTIVYPASSDIKASSTAISLFEKLPLPGLETNVINRTLSVDGATPMILVNGVPSSISDLNSIPPADIEKVEFSRITPARYADRGCSGFLSVTLRQRTDGGTFYGWTRGCPTTGFLDADIKASYHHGESQFSLSYNPSWRNYQDVYDVTEQSFVGNDCKVNLIEKDRNPFNYLMNPISFKYNFTPNKSTLFSATLNAAISSSKRRYTGTTIDTQIGEYNTLMLAQSAQFSPSLDLFFRHDFNDRNTLEIQAVGTLSSDDYRRDNKYVYDAESTEEYIMNVDNRRRSLITEANFTHSFNDATSLSAGYQNTISHSRNQYISSDYAPVLTENNNYIYARLGYQFNKVYVSLSSGLKMFWVKNDLNKRSFIRNISQAQASWTINNKWSLQAAFRYSPSIPGISSLTDHPQQTSPYLVSNGNPNLKVSEYYNYQLSGSYTYKKLSTTLMLSCLNTRNPATTDLRYLGNGLFLSQSMNYDTFRRSFGNLYVKMSDIAGFGASLNISLEHYNTKLKTEWAHSLTAISGSLSLWWNKGPVTISYWRKLPGKYLSGQVVGKNENGDMLQVEYRPNKHWTIGASWMYMFETRGTQYPSWNYSAINPSIKDRYIKDNANMVVFSASYSADFGSIFRSGRRTLNNSDTGSSLLKM